MTTEVTKTITIKRKSSKTKGHFARLERQFEIVKRLKAADPQAVRDMADFVIKDMDVEAPPEATQADIKAFIMDLSEDEVSALFGGDTVDPQSAV